MSDVDEGRFYTSPARPWESPEFKKIVGSCSAASLFGAWLFGSSDPLGAYLLLSAVSPVGFVAYHYLLGDAFRDLRPDLNRKVRRWYDRIRLALSLLGVGLVCLLWAFGARFV